MYRLLASLLVLASASPTLGAEFGEPVEVLKNGGFEQGLEHWQPMQGHTLVENPKAAHSGERAAMGEATAPRQALKLIQEVPVRKGNLYEFSCWAKATNRAKLVIFGTFPGEEQRRMIAVFQDVPHRWTRYETLVDAPTEDGMLQLEVICPSSYALPPRARCG